MFVTKPIPILAFELGVLKVFFYQTIQEWSDKKPVKEYFYRSENEPDIISGPYASIKDAVTDFSNGVKKLPVGKENVIEVDFIMKKRL